MAEETEENIQDQIDDASSKEDALDQVDETKTKVEENDLSSQENKQEDSETNKKSIPEWAERRFGQLTAEKHAERREKERLAAENASLSKRIKELFGETPVEGSPVSSVAPNPAELEKLVDARAEQKAAISAFNNKANKVADDGAKEYKDFEDARQTLISAYGDVIKDKPQFLEAIVESLEGHKVFYHLGKNPQEAERILSLAPVPMALEIGRIAADLSKPKSAVISNAPAPIRDKVNGSAKPVLDPDDPELPIEEWMRWRESDLARRGNYR